MNVREMLEERLGIFDGFYDKMQVFGPIDKADSFEKQGRCFAGANCMKHNSCENCIALRSLRDDRTYVKYEEHEGKIVHVTSSPFLWGEKQYIVELFRGLSAEENGSLGIVKEETLKYVEQLNYKLMHDKLTGVYNRMYLEEKMVFQMVKAYEKGCVSVAMCDIDFFKKINDTYGHQAGDEVLLRFAQVLKEETKGTACKIARYGGEEFLIVMPGMGQKEAIELLERARKNYEQLLITYGEKKISSTASFGLVTKEYQKGISFESADFIKAADQNVYHAKRQGRNQIVASF